MNRRELIKKSIWSLPFTLLSNKQVKAIELQSQFRDKYDEIAYNIHTIFYNGLKTRTTYASLESVLRKSEDRHFANILLVPVPYQNNCIYVSYNIHFNDERLVGWICTDIFGLSLKEIRKIELRLLEMYEL